VPCEHCHHEFRCTSYTSYTAVFASIARLHVAYDLGLRQVLSKEDCSKIERAAGRHAAIQTLQEAIVLGLTPTCSVAQGAMESSDLQKLRWLCTVQHCPLPQDATLIAASQRKADMLRFLQQSGCVFNEHTSYAAARAANNPPVLQLLVDSGCPLNKYVCNAAAAAGDLVQLKWLHARGASLATISDREVSRGASVPIVCWLLEHADTEELTEGVFAESTMALAAGRPH
jgi:hypothetical protein